MLSRSSNKPVPGGGNRGPSPPEAFGGGGGGGGRGDGDGVHGFRQQLQRYRLGLLFTIASIVMLFISFTTLFVARRGAGKFDPLTGAFQSDWIPVSLPMKILLINTAVLLASCLLVEIARRAARLEAILVPMSKIPGVRAIRQTSLWWVWATALAGFGFLFGQYRAWQQLHLSRRLRKQQSSQHILLLADGNPRPASGGGPDGVALRLPGGRAKALAGAALHHPRRDRLVLALHGRHVALCAAGVEADGLIQPHLERLRGRTIIERFGNRQIAAVGVECRNRAGWPFSLCPRKQS